MSKFSIKSDFNSAQVKIPHSTCSIELKKTGKDEYAVLFHEGSAVFENGVYSLFELKALYGILTQE